MPIFQSISKDPLERILHYYTDDEYKDWLHRKDIDTTNAIGDGRGTTPLMASANRNIKELAVYLLDRGADVNRRVDVKDSHLNGNTPLFFAVGNRPIFDLFLERGADPLARNSRDETLLHQALCSHEETDFIKYLLDLGVDPALRNRFGQNAAEYARRVYCDSACINLLEEALESPWLWVSRLRGDAHSLSR